MFGKTDSITDAYGCPQYFPDYREYFSSNPDDRWTDRICPDGTWEANLFQFYYRVYPKLAAALPKPFALKDGIREDETPTHTALREAFINALVHCDIRLTQTLRSSYTRIVTYSPIQAPCCSPLPNIIREATAYAATRPCKRCSC